MRLRNDELLISISDESYTHMLKIREVNRILRKCPNNKYSDIEYLVFEKGVNSDSYKEQPKLTILK